MFDMRAIARGASATFTMSTPLSKSIFAPARALDGSRPGAGLTSTETTNLPAATFAAKSLRSASGVGSRTGTACEVALALVRPTSARRSPSMRPDFAIHRTCSGVVPQQPPIIVAPIWMVRRAKTSRYSGVAM